MTRGPNLPGATCVQQGSVEGWIEIASPQNRALVRALREDLGAGESDAIALAVERGLMSLLIDESEGRRRAEGLGVNVIGTIGILLRAKTDGDIVAVKPLIEELVTQHGFRLRQSLVENVLRVAGEFSDQP